MQIYRIADGRHPLWDATGAATVGGRWNSPGHGVIYGSLSSACAMLEVLAHAGTGRLPRTHQLLVASVPHSVAVERHTAQTLPAHWDDPACTAARAFGDEWRHQARSAVLVVPSVVARLEFNAVVNPAHPHFARIATAAPQAVVWDERLFARR